MPSTKQGGGHTLTFSKKNKDVRDILNKYKKEAKETGESFIANDYICEAIRFYEKNKDNGCSGPADISLNLEKLVEEKIKELMKSGEEVATIETKNIRILEEKLPEEDIEED